MKPSQQLLDSYRNEHIEIVGISVEVEGQTLVFDQDMDDAPEDGKIHFYLPEYASYVLTFKYKCKRHIKKLSYRQGIKKGGITVKTRHEHMADEAPANDETLPIHTITLPPDELPGGMLVRGSYLASSCFLEDGKEVLLCPWSLDIIKKGQKPRRG